MIRSEVKVFDRFGEVTEEVELLAREAVTVAARVAAEVAQASARLDLELELIPAHGTEVGYAAGIKSRKKTRDPRRSTRIAVFFDKGTLGKRRGVLSPKTRRKSGWTVERGTGSYTAERHEITGEMGVDAQRFLVRARIAGRKALLEIVNRGLHS